MAVIDGATTIFAELGCEGVQQIEQCDGVVPA